MLKLIDKIAHRLWLLWYGDEEMEKRLETLNGELKHIRGLHQKAVIRLYGAAQGLDNIRTHADYANRGIVKFPFAALRDYAKEAMGEPNRGDTDGVTAYARWGYDFTRHPEYGPEPTPNRATY